MTAVAAEGRKIIYTNIGNPHAVGQKPITYYRQVLSLCDLPPECGVDNPTVASGFPADVVDRARELRAAIGDAGTGAYTNSQGIGKFRNDVAQFITARDGHISLPSNIFLTNGASSAIEFVLTGLIGGNRDAIMIPIPQYPIYSAIISRLGARQVGYYLGKLKRGSFVPSVSRQSNCLRLTACVIVNRNRRRQRLGNHGARIGAKENCGS